MIIVHKCLSCGHHDTAGWQPGDRPEGASLGAESYEWPRQSCHQGCHRNCEWSEPQTVPTYTWPHDRESTVYPPGQPWSMGIIPCGCMNCRGLYAEVTA